MEFDVLFFPRIKIIFKRPTTTNAATITPSTAVYQSCQSTFSGGNLSTAATTTAAITSSYLNMGDQEQLNALAEWCSVELLVGWLVDSIPRDGWIDRCHGLNGVL